MTVSKMIGDLNVFLSIARIRDGLIISLVPSYIDVSVSNKAIDEIESPGTFDMPAIRLAQVLSSK